MEPAQKPLRHVLVLGKFQVKSVSLGTTGVKMAIDLGRGITMNADIPFPVDVKVGDRLTFYTEVLGNANALPPPLE
jgi:hypothetical protein